jgi:YVTN family beta-propeller protein
VSSVNIGSFITGQPVASTQMKDSVKTRQIFKVGRSPQGLSCFPDRNGLLVANQGDDSITELNTSTGQVVTTLTVGAGPSDVSCTELVYVGITPIGWFAWVACEGGAGDAEGSCALWWDNIQSNIARQASGIGSIQAIMTGFKNPNTQQYDYGLTGDGLRSAFVANRGGDYLSKVSINISGGGVSYTFLPSKLDVKVGNNPSSVCIDPVLPPNFIPPVIVSADSGSSQLSFFKGNELISPHYLMEIPGVRTVCSYWSQ